MPADSLRVLFITSEIAPFSKTGGLADVSAALPKALARRGLDVKVISPLYGSIPLAKFDFVPIRNGVLSAVHFLGNALPIEFVKEDSANPPVYFVNCDALYDRPGVYVDPFSGSDYVDNDYRYLTLCQAAFELCNVLSWEPDILHCNDWQTALCIFYLGRLRAKGKLNDTRSVFTIHNLAYHGLFSSDTVGRIGNADSLFFPGGPLEFYEHVNFLKAGIELADVLNTVSPTYAREIQSSYEFGYGLESVLSSSSHRLKGILNGIDDEIWNPETDKSIPVRYGVKSLDQKLQNKLALCGKVGFKFDEAVPLIGIISRIVHQKGFDILAPIIPEILGIPAQVVILGSGDPHFEHVFHEFGRVYPQNFASKLDYDEELAHLIEAGADLFLMPSRFEPCGLNQMMSMRYGTIPIVRATGGLADTVVDADQSPTIGTGFVFHDFHPEALRWAIGRAVSAFRDKLRWQTIQQRGMQQDFSWSKSASEYIELYRTAIAQPPRFA